MPLNPTQLQALRDEMVNDPRGYGYAADLSSGNDAGLVTRLNTRRDGTNVPPAIQLSNATADTEAIRAAVTKAAYDGLTTGDRSWLNWLTGAGSIVVNADNLQTLAGIPTSTGSVWSTGTRTAMNAAMDALLRYFGSRSQELFVVSVTDVDVANAKKLI